MTCAHLEETHLHAWASVNFWHETRTGGKASKQCGLVTCLRSVRLSVCVCLGRGMPSESEWLWGLMGRKRSVGTVSWWENSSGWECTDPLEPAHIQQQSHHTRGTQSNFSVLHFVLYLTTWLGPVSAKYALGNLHLCYKLWLCHMVTGLWRQEHVAVVGQGVCAPHRWLLDAQ